MLERFRDNEGADQLDLFPETRGINWSLIAACAVVGGFGVLLFII